MEKRDIQEAMLLAIDDELPIEERNALMQLIAQDPALLLEWELLQGAVVDNNETIVFHDKVNLYAITNNEHQVKSKSKLAIFKYAAALALIVFSVLGVWLINKKSDSVVATNLTNSPSQSIKDNALNNQKSIVETVKDIVPEVSDKVAIENKKTINEHVEILSIAPNKITAQHKNKEIVKREFGKNKVEKAKKEAKQDLPESAITKKMKIENTPSMPTIKEREEIAILNSCNAKLLASNNAIQQKGNVKVIKVGTNQNLAIIKSAQRKGISFELSDEKFAKSNNKTIQTLYDISKNINTVIADFKEVKNGVHVEVALPKIFN